MSKRPTEPDDWSRQSEALFHDARGTHAPTAADRARVRSALAHKLAAASGASSFGGDAEPGLAATGARHAALVNLVKVGLGVACVTAGAFAFMRAGDSQPHATTSSTATQTSAPGAKPAQPARVPDVAARDAAGTTHFAPAPPAALRSQGASPARPVAPRSRAQSTAAKVSESVPAPPPAPPPTLARRRAELAAVQPASVRERSSASESASPSSSAVAQDSAGAGIAPAEDAADARAELAFVARISAAERASKPRTVLALCAEHERRWPDGTFVQEREGLRAIASCNSDAVGADARARAFLARYPRGPLAVRVGDECASQLEADGPANP